MTTIKDIAKKVGVSVTTVSRALNDYDDVSLVTKEQIQAVAKELNYVPNRSAQNLVTKQNKTLAIILSGLEPEGGKDNIVYGLLAGMYCYAESINYEVVLFTMSSALQTEKTYVQFCKEHNIGGAVLNGIRTDDPYLKELVDSDLPCVLIDVFIEGKNTSSISIDNVQAAKDAVTYLIENGHRNIGMINGRREAAVSEERLEGYAEGLKQNNLLYKDSYVVYADFLEKEAYEKSMTLMSKYPEITALFCASDMMAIGAIKAAKKLGKKVPRDISIVGFDNIPIAEYSSPTLTTIGQDFYAMGQKAAKQLVKMIKGEKVKKRVLLKHKLLARDSVSML